MNYIYGGSILNILKQILNLIDKGLDQLSKYGVKIKDSKEEDLKDGRKKITKTFYVGDNDEVVTAVIIIDPHTELMDVEISDKHRHKESKQKIKKVSDFNKFVMNYMIKYYHTDTYVEESKHCKVSLQKVVGSRNIKINLVNVIPETMRGYEIKAALDFVLDDEEFVDSIPEELTTFSFIDLEDSIDAEPESQFIESVSQIADAACDMLRSAFVLWNIAFTCEYSVKGPNSGDIMTFVNDVIYAVDSQIREFYQIGRESGNMSSPLTIIRSVDTDIVPDSTWSESDWYNVIRMSISQHQACIECYYRILGLKYRSKLINMINYLTDLERLAARRIDGYSAGEE